MPKRMLDRRTKVMLNDVDITGVVSSIVVETTVGYLPIAKMTVHLSDITRDGEYIVYHLGNME